MSATPEHAETASEEEVKFVTERLATYEDDKKDAVDALDALANMQCTLKTACWAMRQESQVSRSRAQNRL